MALLVTTGLEGVDVGEVFRTRCGPFVTEKGFAAKKINGVATKRPFHAIGPDVVPLYPTDRTHHMDLHGRHSHLQHPAAIDDRLLIQLRHGKTERVESRQ